MNHDPWHFPRKELAEQTLTVLTSGAAQALTLFAPRRTGKTEFLIQDFNPLAADREHVTVYASFWQAKVAPLATLLHALESALKAGSVGDRLVSLIKGMQPKLKLSSPSGAVTAEVDVSELAGEPPGELLLHLDELLERLVARSKRPAILLLDEAQELARDEANQALVAALRTSLDKRTTALKAIFTGSSYEGLQAMFGAREAPFFHFATPINLPAMGEDFVDHLLKTFSLTARRKLDRKEVLEAFDQLHRNPYYFRRLLDALLLDRNLPIGEAVDTVRGRVAGELGYPDTWLTLTPIQRATATVLAAGAAKPFSADTRRQIGNELGEDAPSIGRVQSAIRRLERLGLADTHTGTWSLVDPEFARWILDKDDSAGHAN